MKNSMRYLLGVFALVLITNFASAQYVDNDDTKLGDGDNPYVGTEYTYTVTLGAVGNTVEWFVYDTNTEYAAVTPVVSAKDYDKVDGTPGTTVSTKITWNETGTFYLTYKETSTDGCSTFRGVEIKVTENSFYLELADDITNVCNGLEGDVLNWTIYKDKTDVPTTLTYTVDVMKDADFDITTWEFDGELVKTSADLSFVSVSSNDPDATINLTGNTFTVRGAKVNQLILTVTINSKVTTADDVRLNLTNGVARTGTLVTNDNTTKGGDRFQINSLKGLPAATNISF